MRREWWLAGAVVLALAACSGDDDATTSTTDATPTSTSVSTTAPTTSSSTTMSTTAVPSSIVAPTTTLPDPTTTDSPPSTASTTIPDGVPPRVTFPDDPEKQAVVDAVYAYFDALNRAQAAPSVERSRREVEATMTVPVEQRVLEYLDRLVADGEAFVDLGPQPTTIEIYGEVMSVVDEAALVDACVVDRTSHIEVAGGDDGSDRVIDDQVIAAVVSYSIVRVGDDWLVANVATANRFEGEEQCG